MKHLSRKKHLRYVKIENLHNFFSLSLSSVLGSFIRLHLYWTIPEKNKQGVEDMEFPGLLKK